MNSDLTGLVRRGLAVFPLPPGSKAAAPGWHRQCTTDLTVAAGWPAGSNTGVGCRASSIVGLDLDRHVGKPDGVASFARLSGEHGAGWPSTFTVATPSGGLHLYFRVPAGLLVPSAVGIWPGVDTRGPGLRLGGYLGPGSVVGGRRYEIARDDPIAELPGWLAALIIRPASARHAFVNGLSPGSVTPAPTPGPPPRPSRN